MNNEETIAVVPFYISVALVSKRLQRQTLRMRTSVSTAGACRNDAKRLCRESWFESVPGSHTVRFEISESGLGEDLVLAHTVPKFAARDIVDNSVKNARPGGVPGTKTIFALGSLARSDQSVQAARVP